MKPSPFAYFRVEHPDQAAELLARYGESGRILAGGQSLVPALNMRLATPGALFDISRCEPLKYVECANGKMKIGAAATQGSVEWRETLHEEVPLLRLTFPFISHFQIRNRGTVCGSVAHADPSAELPLCLALLDGEVTLRSTKGQRTLRAKDFFQGMLTTAKRQDEFVESVAYPLAQPGTGYAFDEFALRHGDFAVVACAAAVTDDEIRLAVGGVADRPMVARWARLQGQDLDDAINDFAWSLRAQDDNHVTAVYRRHLVRKLGRGVIEAAGERTQERMQGPQS